MPLTALDVGVIVLVLLSALLALSRGFVREVLSLATWIGALAVAVHAFLPVRPIIAEAAPGPLVTDVVTAAVVFLVPLIAFKILAAMIARRIDAGPHSTLDKGLGLAFGVARGVLVVAAGYLLLDMLVKPERRPDWVQRAYFRPQIEASAAALRRVLPPEIELLSLTAPAPAAGRPTGPGAASGQGYPGEQRRQMNEQIERLTRQN